MAEAQQRQSRPAYWRRLFLARVRDLRQQVYILYLALRHPGTPRYAKLALALVVAYALSPIDFIPDFIPVLGYLDDFLLIPAGVALALRLVPPQVLAECRAQAAARPPSARPQMRAGAALIILLWLLLALAVWRWWR